MQSLTEHELAILNSLPARPVSLNPATSADVLLVGGRCLLALFTIKEVTGNVVAWQLLDGNDANGKLITDFSTGANNSPGFAYGQPVLINQGLFLHFVSGTGKLRGAFHVIY